MTSNERIPNLRFNKYGAPIIPTPIENPVGVFSGLFAIAIPFLAIALPARHQGPCAIEALPTIKYINSISSAMSAHNCIAQTLLFLLLALRLGIITFCLKNYINQYKRLYGERPEVLRFVVRQVVFLIIGGCFLLWAGCDLVIPVSNAIRAELAVLAVISMGIILGSEGLLCSIIYSYIYISSWRTARKI